MVTASRYLLDMERMVQFYKIENEHSSETLICSILQQLPCEGSTLAAEMQRFPLNLVFNFEIMNTITLCLF